MRPRDLASILARASGLWMLFKGVLLLESIPIAFFSPISASDSFTRAYSIGNFLALALHLAVGLILVLKTGSVADYLARGLGQSHTVEVSLHDLAILSFGVVGIVIFVDGLEKAIAQGVTLYAKPEITYGAGLVRTNFSWPLLAAGLTRMVAGFVLLLTPRGLVNFLTWTRSAGLDR